MIFINFYTKQVYGVTKNYLVASNNTSDGEAAQTILQLLGQKTISEEQMQLFKKLGIEFHRVFEPSK